jgi:hypothetical protein
MPVNGYKIGYLMCLRKDDLQKVTGPIGEFISKSLPKKGVAAKF